MRVCRSFLHLGCLPCQKRLGYPLSSQRRRQLWCRVDLDKSGWGAQHLFVWSAYHTSGQKKNLTACQEPPILTTVQQFGRGFSRSKFGLHCEEFKFTADIIREVCTVGEIHLN